MKRIFYIILPAALLMPVALQAQNDAATGRGDSLGLPAVINKVIGSYPSVKKAEQDIEAANARIGLAKAGYYPVLDFESSYSHIGPIATISLPELGTFSLNPPDNYSAAVNLNQTLYDFGKTSRSVDLENQNKVLSQLSVEQLKQRLSLSLLGNYYSVVYLQKAIRIKDQELDNLNEHLRYVEKKASTGSATQYEILTTKVRISNIENQKTDLQTSLKIQLSQLNSFLGQSQDAMVNLKEELKPAELVPATDQLVNVALANRDEMKIARQKSAIADTKLKVVNAQNNPVFNFFASGGLKNGYVPDLGVAKANYAVGVGFKVPLFDGTRTKYNRMQVVADKAGVDQDTELARRSIVNEIVEAHANVDASAKKVAQSQLQLRQAKQAYALAETSFGAGAITNLDLLDSSTSLSESQLAVIKANIDYTVSLLKLKIATGEHIY
jgi:outer membrane protein TolC